MYAFCASALVLGLVTDRTLQHCTVIALVRDGKCGTESVLKRDVCNDKESKGQLYSLGNHCNSPNNKIPRNNYCDNQSSSSSSSSPPPPPSLSEERKEFKCVLFCFVLSFCACDVCSCVDCLVLHREETGRRQYSTHRPMGRIKQSFNQSMHCTAPHDDPTSSSIGCLVVSVLGLGLVVVGTGGPESEVVSKELKNEGTILVLLLVQSVQTEDGLVESILRELASGLSVLDDLVEADGVVEGEAETHGVSGLHDGGGRLHGSLVVVGGLALELGKLVVGDELGEVTEVVTSHLLVEDLGLLGGLGVRDEGLLEELKYVLAEGFKLGLDDLTETDNSGVILVLVNVESTPRSTAGCRAEKRKRQRGTMEKERK